MQRILLCILSIFLLTLSVRADLLLSIDTNTEMLTITGSDSGHVNRSEVYLPPYWTWPGGEVPISVIYWELPVHENESDALDINSVVNVFVNGSPSAPFRFSLINVDDIGVGIGWWGDSSPTESDIISVVGNGSFVSYSAWNASQKTALENLIAAGTPLSLTSGTDFNPIAVPEPQSSLLILAALAALKGYAKRKT